MSDAADTGALIALYNEFYSDAETTRFRCPTCGSNAFNVSRSGQRGASSYPRHSGECSRCHYQHTITRDNDPKRGELPPQMDAAASEELKTNVRSGTWHCPFDGTRVWNESKHDGRFIVTCPRCRVSAQGEI